MTTGVSVAGIDEELFFRGNKYYEQKDYDNALRSYEMMAKKGRAVLYNMGNVYFYKGDYAQALVCWSRAQIGATPPEYNLIARNKEHVFTIIGKSSERPLTMKMIHLGNDIIPYVSLLLLQLFFLVCWYVFLFAIRKNQIKIKKIVMTSLCIFMISSGVLLGVYYVNQCTQSGIVVKKEGQLFAAPDKNFHELCLLAYAHDVIVKETRQGWYKIQYADMIGWVEADVIQII
jgi:tetratricopeptide (TPR) repeat protein